MMRPTDLWPKSARIVEVGATCGAIGQRLVAAGYRNYLAVTATERRRERIAAQLGGVIQRTMVQAGFSGAVPDYLALRHLRPKERTRILEGLRLRAECSDDLANLGHHGPNDVLLSLDRGLKRGVVKDGSLVLLASAGIGFTYAAALIQWGPP